MLDYYRDADEIVTVDDSSEKQGKTGKQANDMTGRYTAQWKSEKQDESGKSGKLGKRTKNDKPRRQPRYVPYGQGMPYPYIMPYYD